MLADTHYLSRVSFTPKHTTKFLYPEHQQCGVRQRDGATLMIQLHRDLRVFSLRDRRARDSRFRHRHYRQCELAIRKVSRQAVLRTEES